MEKKLDRRLRKSKESIKGALLYLLEKKYLEDITITELCKCADVTRATFYAHYSNPQECFQEISEQIYEEMVQQLNKQEERTYERFLSVYMSMIEKNRSFFREIHHTQINNPFILKMGDLSKKYMGFGEKHNKMDRVTEQFFMYGFFGCIHDWIEYGCEKDMNEFKEMYVGVTKKWYWEISKGK